MVIKTIIIAIGIIIILLIVYKMKKQMDLFRPIVEAKVIAWMDKRNEKNNTRDNK